MQQDFVEILCSPVFLFYVSPSPHPTSSHPRLHSRYTEIIRLFICLITSLQQLSFKLRAQSCLNCPIILVKPQSLLSGTMGTWHFSWNYTCTLMKRRMPWWLKVCSSCPLNSLYLFSKKLLCWFLGYLNVITILATSEFLPFWMNSLLACPKQEERCQESAPWEWQRTSEDMVCETIWVIFVKDLEAAAVSLLQRINSQTLVASSNDIWNPNVWREGVFLLVGHLMSRSFTHPDPIYFGAPPSSGGSDSSPLRLWMRNETVMGRWARPGKWHQSLQPIFHWPELTTWPH